MTRPDPIEIMTRRIAVGLVRSGKMSVEQATVEAEEEVEWILNEMAKLGLQDQYLYAILRRNRVYRMRSSGLTIKIIAERLNICVALAKRDYRAEMLRRRQAA